MSQQRPMSLSCLPLDAVARAAASPESRGMNRQVDIEFVNGTHCCLEFRGTKMMVDGKPIWMVSSICLSNTPSRRYWPCIGKLPHVVVGNHFLVRNQDTQISGTVASITTLVEGIHCLTRD